MRISIIVAAYNVAPYLDKCLKSIQEQTHKDFEVIVVDDGSTDDTPVICDKYAQNDFRFTIIHKKNEGLVCARRDGVKKATSEYVYFVDGDDWLYPGVVAELISPLKSNGCDMVIGNYSYWINGRESLVHLSYVPEFYDTKRMQNLKDTFISKGKIFTFGLNPALWCKLFKKNNVEKIYDLIPSDITLGEDFALFVPYFLECRSVALVDSEQVYCYQIRNGSITNSYDPNLIVKVKKLKSYIDSAKWKTQVDNQLNDYWAMIASRLIDNQMSVNSKKKNQIQALLKIYEVEGLIDSLKKIPTNRYSPYLRFRLMPLIRKDVAQVRVRVLLEKKILQITKSMKSRIWRSKE